MIKNILKRMVPWIERDIKIYKLYKKSRNYMVKNKKYIASYYSYKIYKKYGCEISQNAEIGEKLMLPHPIGIVIGEGVKIANNCVIYQNVTLGRKDRNISKYPVIGNNVTIYAGAKIVGDVKIGNNAIIGTNAVVLEDVPENSIAVGIPAKIIKRKD